MVNQVPVFLLRTEKPSYILQGGGGKLIIGFRDKDDVGGGTGSPAKSIQKGYSQVLKQLPPNRPVVTAKATSLGTLILKNLYNKVSSKLVFPFKIKMEGKIRVAHPEVKSKSLLVSKSGVTSKGSILHKQRAYIQSEMFIKSRQKPTKPLPDYTIADNVKQIRQEMKIKEEQKIRKEKITKLLKIKRILTEDIRKAPSIDVGVNEIIHQRGDIMRITANMSERTGSIYMRIIDKDGVIVQKAGLVKKNAAGFQILVGTKDLKAGKYFIQVSNHDSFSPLGVAEFQIKGTTPILGFLPLVPLLLLTPGSPTEKFEFEVYRTMMDSRVDAKCKEFENKVYRAGEGPMPPIHFNCRCFREGKEE